MSPFVVIGQERSGTTLVQMLLNSHSALHCRGELFDPWQIDDDGNKIQDVSLLRARDANPGAFVSAAMQGADLSVPVKSGGATWIAKLGRNKGPRLGFKFLTQHHPMVLKEILPAHPDMPILHVTRANKLAQFASLQQVHETGRWTETRASAPVAPKLTLSPLWAVTQCNRLENEDFLLNQFLDQLPNPVLRLPYASLRDASRHTEMTAFLNVSDCTLTSPLKKQGQNRVLERFENADEIAAHFTAIGREAWLGAET
ncbi:MAG: sulfotransferase [Shimia sp.]|nr:sulfotransferase [Shimia sp.]